MSTPPRVLVSGGTGLVGGRLVRTLCASGCRVGVLTRRPERVRADAGFEAVGWDGRSVPAAALAGSAQVIHLAGEPLFGGLPSAARRRRIRDSRVESTRALVTALGALPRSERPETLLCASATGYYGARGETLLDETCEPGSGFLAELCRDWEVEAARAEAHGVRPVSLRIGVVLAREGGALAMMAPAFRMGLGGPLGNGRQWLSWIHVDDLVALARQLLESRDVAGAVNAVAPAAVRNLELSRELARLLRRPARLRVPAFALRAALGELSGELLGSRRVTPARAIALGFRFRHPEIGSALEAELGGSRASKPA